MLHDIRYNLLPSAVGSAVNIKKQGYFEDFMLSYFPLSNICNPFVVVDFTKDKSFLGDTVCFPWQFSVLQANCQLAFYPWPLG